MTLLFYFSRNKHKYKDDMEEILIELQNSSFKGVAIYDDASLKVQNFNRTKKLYFQTINQKFMSYNLGYCVRENNFFKTTFMKKIAQLIEGGFIDLWDTRAKNHWSLAKDEAQDNRVVLTMNHLGVGFLLWCLMLLVAGLAFAVEWLSPRAIERVRRN